MTHEERLELNRLCRQVQRELDAKRLIAVMTELRDLLDRVLATFVANISATRKSTTQSFR